MTKRKQPELSYRPQNISKETWYYEEHGGLEVIHELPERIGQPLHIKIPWRKVVVSVSRYLAAKNARKAAR